MLTRRRLEIALGLFWLLDGALQFQPFMFTAGFFDGILGMANMGLPHPLSVLDFRVASMLAAHPAFWNSVFATIQVALGVGLIWKRTARLARPASVLWALGVWVIGEGIGGLFMGGTSLINGAPGSALLYAVAAIALWPACAELAGEHASASLSVAASGRLGERAALAMWAFVWCGPALLEFEVVNHSSAVPGAQLRNSGYGQPAFLERLNTGAGHLVGNHGALFAAALGLAATFVGLGVLVPHLRRAALTMGAILAVFVGVVGQDLGSIFTGRGTDPGSGPLLVLLTLSLWPLAAAAAPARRRPVLAIGAQLRRPLPAVASLAGSVHHPSIDLEEVNQCPCGDELE